MVRKVKVPARPQDCKTVAEKVAYSNMIHERWESIDYDAPPSEILDFDKFPMDDPSMPWTHPEWSANYARTELDKLRMGRAKRRLLRGK
jgi:hypothetical protein